MTTAPLAHAGTIDGREVLIRTYPDGAVTAATRIDVCDTWGPEVDLAATCDPATYIAAVEHAEAAVGGAL